MMTSLVLALVSQSGALQAAPAAPTEQPPAAARSAEHLAWGDQDGAGRLDHYIAEPTGGRLLIQRADGRFTQVAAGLVPALPG